MNTCSTCKFWVTRESVLGPPDKKTVAHWKRSLPDSWKARLHRERKEMVCSHDWFNIYEMVDEAVDTTGIHTDYSTGMLITEARFGCVHHEEKIMKYRKHDWLNTETMEPQYGIQAKHPETGKWLHCIEDSKLLTFTTMSARDEKMKELEDKTP